MINDLTFGRVHDESAYPLGFFRMGKTKMPTISFRESMTVYITRS